MKKHFYCLLLVICLLFTSLCSCGELGFSEPPYGNSNTDGDETIADGGSIESNFAIHFIDVGQADATLIICKDKTMLIDGGNAEDSDLIYSYLKKQNITHLDYVVCTHAHEDHVGGLSGALTAATASHVLSPVTSYDSRAFESFVTKAHERGCELEIPKAGDQFSLGDAKVYVLGPVKQYDDTNDTSIVLRIVYGSTSFLFTGDMESGAEKDLIESGAMLRSTVLKVGHHGSTTSTSYQFLKAVAPQYGIISVGQNNQYQHPNEDVLSRLRDADVTLYRTDMQGDIICTSNGKTVSFFTEKENNLPTNPTESEKTTSSDSAVTEYAYIGNINSKTLHKSDCSYLPDEKNRIYFTSREEAFGAGYVACGRCNP